jgi:hypothetical protein
MTENKAKNPEQGIIEYCIFSKGVVNISFTSETYTHDGAIERCIRLSKAFSGLTLIVRKDGTKYQLYPTPGDEKRRQQERLRNHRSYAFENRMRI